MITVKEVKEILGKDFEFIKGDLCEPTSDQMIEFAWRVNEMCRPDVPEDVKIPVEVSTWEGKTLFGDIRDFCFTADFTPSQDLEIQFWRPHLQGLIDLYNERLEGVSKQRVTYSTKILQINSLLAFADKLGYIPVDEEQLSKGFRVKDFTKRCTHFISFTHMCKLHNRDLRYHIFNAPLWVTQLNLSWEQYTYALEYKLVETIKLQKNKKGYIGITCQNHYVKLTELGKSIYNFEE